MSSQARSASGGVRNLRAMFETKDDSSTTSPPLKRGRSPGPSIRNNGASPRQLSKVQTNFVAVERNGESGIQWGLKIDPINTPDTPTMTGRRGSFSMHEETDHMDILERKKSITDEFQARKDDVDISETIPEFAVETPITEKSNILGQKGDAVDPKPPTTSTGNPDKMTSEEEPNTRLLPGNPTSSEAVSGGKALTGSSGMGEDLKGISTAKLKTVSPAKAKSKVTTGKTISKPAPIATSKSSTSARSSSKSSKSPALPKTPVTPGHSVRSASSRTSATAAVKTAKPATEKVTKPLATMTNAPKPNGKPSGALSAANPAVKKPALPPASTGFVKPKPKSPTRPAKLPSSLTAPTSASLSKTSSPPAAHPVRRPIGAASSAVSTTANSHAARSSSRPAPAQRQEALRKTASVTRPSLGPPPAILRKQPSRQSLAKPGAPADEGFLARMMRPTTASASKTHEKGLTPPKATRVLPSRPSTRNGHHAKLESHGSPVGKAHVAAAKAVHGKAKARKSIEKVDVPEKETASEPAIVDAEPEKVESEAQQKYEQLIAGAESATAVPAEEQVTQSAPVETSVEAPVEEETSAPAAAVEESVPTATGPKADAIEEPVAVPEPVTLISEQSIVTDKVDVPEIMEEDEKKENIVTDKVDVPEIMEEDEKEENIVTDKVDVPEIMEEDEKKENVVTDKIDVPEIMDEDEKKEEAAAAEAVAAEQIDTSEEAKADGVPAVETPAAADKPETKVDEQDAAEPEAQPIDEEIAEADVEKDKLEMAQRAAVAAVTVDASVEKSVDHVEDVDVTALSS